jgi:hypothetical protein
MSRSIDHGGLVVLLRGRNERLVLDMFSMLSECFPHRQGPAFESAFLTLRVQTSAEAAIGILNSIMSVMATMKAAGRLPRFEAHRQTAGKNELFLLAMLSAAQRTDKARPIEAAIALLDTGHVFSVNVAVRALATRLKDAGILLAPVNESVFAQVAGYPAISEPTKTVAMVERPIGKPELRILKSA